MPRYKLTIEYDGRQFSGWQQQADQPSIQQSVSEAIQGFCGENVTVYGAGRTDAGVHATGQVAHIILSKDWEARVVQNALNFHLRPLPIVIMDAIEIDDTFDARFSAVRRHYRYEILNRRVPITFEKGLAWHVYHDIDAGKMHEAAQALVGQHDFTTFRASQCQAKSAVKTLDKISVARNAERVTITVSARSFLHHQVRSITGSLERVGVGKWPVAQIAEVLKAQDRSQCGTMAPPDGLYLTQVDYA